ncbi:NAD(P)/FAD-dependent oxidoreductase [Mariniplasma anaerobium]|uniref:Thioredoxin reductase n=1 Tax=Mariniplasma anaerobium TaxID=2735436 RepID=A0A7U9XW50_9MOLU|nr:NAD(P)/FAD-dependent oxidoreductase [Mariniplasma anaerobium]BCR35365.1 thioredoxin reductase [Mariniplasma anaerobium]
MKDVIIIGVGPAGISAAIYLKRAGMNPLVIGQDFGTLKSYPGKIENYYGFESPISGDTLIENGIKQAKNLKIDILMDSVISLDQVDDYFTVKTIKHKFSSKIIILATGKRRLSLSIPGFNQFKGKGISFCATCDGYFFRRKKIAIIGCGAYMLNELAYLSQINKDITVFTNGHELNQDVDFPVVNQKIVKFLGTNKLSHIETDDGKHYEVQGTFVAIGTPSSIDFATKLGVVIEDNNISVNQNYQTNIEGLFAIGDVIGGKLQIAKAVYDGMMVADNISQYIKKDKK